MRRREFLGSMGARWMAARRPPNIIFVLADDLGWAEPGCYGNRFNETPNLDRMAREGVRFSSAYSSAPVCSPMRASLMTGQFPARVGITDFLRADDEKFLSPSLPTLPGQLSKLGYATALIGKWHLMGDYATRPGDPARHGFQQVVCSESKYIGSGDYFHPYSFMPEVRARHEGEYLVDRMYEEAEDFIRAQAEKPFFLFLSHYAPHTRLEGKADPVRKYARKPGAGKGRNNPQLAAMLESIDDGMGRLIAMLDDLKLAADTLLIFTSDNGGEGNVTSNAPLRGAKSQLYEGGIRIPFLARWPGTIPKATECHTPICAVDYYPTFLKLAGGSLPRNHIVDGVPINGLLQHPSQSLARRALFWHYPLEKPHFLGGRSAGAVREGDWKLIEFYDDHTVELYDLREDPGERKNLAAREAGRAAQLKGRLGTWRGQMERHHPKV